MHISDWPDLCLDRLFDAISLSDLFGSVPLVCQQWYYLSKSALKRRRSVKLYHDAGSLIDSLCLFSIL